MNDGVDAESGENVLIAGVTRVLFLDDYLKFTKGCQILQQPNFKGRAQCECD
jgi:hypothetical protein